MNERSDDHEDPKLESSEIKDGRRPAKEDPGLQIPFDELTDEDPADSSSDHYEDDFRAI